MQLFPCQILPVVAEDTSLPVKRFLDDYPVLKELAKETLQYVSDTAGQIMIMYMEEAMEKHERERTKRRQT